MNSLELGGCVRDATHFVIGECQVQSRAGHFRGLLQRDFVFGNRFSETTKPGQRGAEVGMDRCRFWMKLQKLAIPCHRAFQISGMLLLHGFVREEFFAPQSSKLKKRQLRINRVLVGPTFKGCALRKTSFNSC